MRTRLGSLALSLLFVACTGADGTSDGEMQSATASPAQQDPIALAMGAGPAAITRDATIMDWNEAGELVELRAGTNGWLCVVDENPNAPGDYPACLDGAWQQWFGAYSAGETPEIDGIGISYMLLGGPAASNTDPLAVGPAEGEDWLFDGPHLMIIAPDPAMLDAFPTEHGTGGPYVMWAGTPYAHLMVPSEAN